MTERKFVGYDPSTKVATVMGIGPPCPMMIDPTATFYDALGQQTWEAIEVATFGADVRADGLHVAAGEIRPLEPAPPPDLIVRATIGGERLRLRYVPQPGMTGQEAGWAAQLATFAANPDVDWGDWLAARGMLKHFVVVE